MTVQAFPTEEIAAVVVDSVEVGERGWVVPEEVLDDLRTDGGDVVLGAEEEERDDGFERRAVVVAVVIPASYVRNENVRERLRRTLVRKSLSGDARRPRLCLPPAPPTAVLHTSPASPPHPPPPPARQRRPSRRLREPDR